MSSEIVLAHHPVGPHPAYKEMSSLIPILFDIIEPVEGIVFKGNYARGDYRDEDNIELDVLLGSRFNLLAQQGIEQDIIKLLETHGLTPDIKRTLDHSIPEEVRPYVYRRYPIMPFAVRTPAIAKDWGLTIERLTRHPNFDILEEFINRGIELLKKQAFYEALNYFESPKFAENLGWMFEQPVSIPVENYTQEQADFLIDQIAYISKFDPNLKGTTESPLISFPTLRQVSREANPYILQNAALVYAEEWIHGLQHLNAARNLTSDEYLTSEGYYDHEVDVAAYLLSKDVTLTPAFLNRYNRRAALN